MTAPSHLYTRVPGACIRPVTSDIAKAQLLLIIGSCHEHVDGPVVCVETELGVLSSVEREVGVLSSVERELGVLSSVVIMLPPSYDVIHVVTRGN